MLIKIRGDGGQRLAQSLWEEAPPERPFIRREDRGPKDPNAPKSLEAVNEKMTEEAAATVVGEKAAEEAVSEAVDAVKRLSLKY